MPASLNFETGNATFVPPCISPAPTAGTSQFGFETGNGGFTSPCPGSFPVANQPPVVNAGPDRIVGLAASLTLSGSVQDDGKPGVALTALWSKVSGPTGLAFGSPTSPITPVTFNKAGAYRLRLTGSDSVLTASDDMALRVTNPGGGGSLDVDAGADQTLILGTNAILSGSVTPSGSNSSSFWRQSSGSTVAVISDAFSLAPSVTLPAIGTYGFELFGSDGSHSAVDSMTVQVTASPGGGGGTCDALMALWVSLRSTLSPLFSQIGTAPTGFQYSRMCVCLLTFTNGVQTSTCGKCENLSLGALAALTPFIPTTGTASFAVEFYGLRRGAKPRTYTPNSTNFKIYALT